MFLHPNFGRTILRCEFRFYYVQCYFLSKPKLRNVGGDLVLSSTSVGSRLVLVERIERLTVAPETVVVEERGGVLSSDE